MPPPTKYATLGDSMIAYQTLGDGPLDIIVISGVASHVDVRWEYRPSARLYERLGSFARVILFDRRGAGASDPVALDALPTWEEWTEDVRAVLDAAGSERAALWAQNDAGPMAMLFAATYPERTSALMVWNTSARWTVADDYPTGLSQEATDALYRALVSGWGSEDLAKVVDPDLAGDEEHNRFLAKLARAAMTPRAVAAQLRMRFELDARAVLPMIRVPTLVLQRRDNAVSRREHGLYIAEHIPGAKYVEIPGRDLAYFTGVDELCDEVEEFLTGIRHVAEPDRVLATVLFSDIVESTARAASLGDRRWKEVLDLHDKTARARVDEFGGRLVKMTGDGVLATFDLPGKAIRCAADLITALRAAGLEIRVGLHTGEIELRGEDVAGIAVVIGARVMSEAGPAEIACSRTVRDLVAGSGFEFEDRGLRSLKGVPESWQIFAVRNAIDPRH